MKIESPFPPEHSRCRLGSSYLEPGQIAGLLDGDGAFTLLRRLSPGGARVRPQVALAMRDDDPTPFAVWASIAAWRGRPMGSLYRSATHRRHEWRVERLDDLADLTDWLARHPLLSPRGQLRFSAIREATLILMASRLPGGGSRRLPAADLARLTTLRASLPVRGDRVDRLPSSPVAPLASANHRGWALSGLIAAEGSFSLRSERSKLAPEFSLSQRIDNVTLLEAYRDEMRIGTIRLRPARASSNALAAWVVSRIDDCAQLVDRLRAYPLPQASPKAEQFNVWAFALHLRAIVTDDGRRHGASSSDALRRARVVLQTLKKYAGPRLLCSCGRPMRLRPNGPDSERGGIADGTP